MAGYERGFMESSKPEAKDLFEELGLQVESGEVEIGKTYPLYGMVTKVLDQSESELTVELNFGITARLHLKEAVSGEIVKERVFEPGIFVSTVTSKDPNIQVIWKTVIFGRRQGFHA